MYRYQDPPPPPAAPKNTNTLALISLIVGIIGILTLLLSLCTWCLGMVPLLLCAAAAVSGYLAKKQIDESGGLQSGRKMAIAGMIVGAAGFVLALVVTGISFAYSGFTALQDIL